MSEPHEKAERMNATVRPSGETAGEKSVNDFGGDVNLRVSPVSVDKRRAVCYALKQQKSQANCALMLARNRRDHLR